MKSWCKVASNLDSHPKIRKAGRLGREVFLFVLRKNAEPDNDHPGFVSAEFLEPWYLADQLMMTEEEAVTGVTACRHARLLIQNDDQWEIVGWGDEWGKAPAAGKDRTAKWREGKKKPKPVTKRDERDVTESHGDARDALDKTRREESIGAPPPAKPLSESRRASDHFQQRYVSAYSQKPDWSGKEGALLKGILAKSGGNADEFIRRTDLLFDGKGPAFLKPPFTLETISANWNRLVSTAGATAPPSTHPSHGRLL